MHFKLIVTFVEDSLTQSVLAAARKAGSTGSTLISQARGEGLEQAATFFGLTLETQRDVIFLLVEQHLSRQILESIAKAGRFSETPGSGIAFQLDVEDAVGIDHQARKLSRAIEREI